jgi:hypothetical protein
MAVMEDIARAAAARRLVVNFHGSTVPRGLQRTWPNVLTMEGVAGAEHAKGGTPIDPAHNVTLAFTRNVIGSMDYTPVTFSANRTTSAGHELAQAVVFESGLQHFADSPESYGQWPAAGEVLRRVPAAWDDTKLIAGRPGESVTVARRSGRAWFVASLRSGAPRPQTVPLSFLSPAQAYVARVTTDDGASLTPGTYDVTANGSLTVPVARNGGFVIEITPSS